MGGHGYPKKRQQGIPSLLAEEVQKKTSRDTEKTQPEEFAKNWDVKGSQSLGVLK